MSFDFVCIYLFMATCPLRHLLASMHSTKTIWPISSAERSSTLQQVCPKSSNLISNSINSAKDSSARKEIVIVKKKLASFSFTCIIIAIYFFFIFVLIWKKVLSLSIILTGFVICAKAVIHELKFMLSMVFNAHKMKRKLSKYMWFYFPFFYFCLAFMVVLPRT